MSESDDRQQAELRIRWDPDAPPAPKSYANYVQVTYAPEDFTMYLGWYSIPALHEPPPELVIEAKVQPVAQVTIPLNLMGNLIGLLQRQLEAYEESLGPIPEHPNKPDWLGQREAKSEAGGEDA